MAPFAFNLSDFTYRSGSKFGIPIQIHKFAEYGSNMLNTDPIWVRRLFLKNYIMADLCVCVWQVSIMVGGLVSKFWDKELKAAELRNEGNR